MYLFGNCWWDRSFASRKLSQKPSSDLSKIPSLHSSLYQLFPENIQITMPIRIQTLIKPIRILSFVWGPYLHKQQNHGSKEKTVALETADNSVTTPRQQTFKQFGGKMCSGEQEPWHDLSLPNLHYSWLVSPLPEIPVCYSQYFPHLYILLISYLFSHTQSPRFLGHCGQGSCVVCVCIPHSH